MLLWSLMIINEPLQWQIMVASIHNSHRSPLHCNTKYLRSLNREKIKTTNRDLKNSCFYLFSFRLADWEIELENLNDQNVSDLSTARLHDESTSSWSFGSSSSYLVPHTSTTSFSVKFPSFVLFFLIAFLKIGGSKKKSHLHVRA